MKEKYACYSTWKSMLCVVIFASFLSQLSNAQQTICSNESNIKDGFSYELWKQENTGYGCMTLKDSCKFSCEWKTESVNFLARRGLKYDETQKPDEIGTFAAVYSCDYQPSGNSYLGIYGWTSTPLVEFYIVESWGTWRPPGAPSKGTITVDGATYDVYESTRTNQPSIKGTATFQQYWSVRTSKRTSGTISITKHFDAWAEKGMNLGYLYDINLLVEGYKSSGKADFTSALLGVDIVVPSAITFEKGQSQVSNVILSPNPISGILNITVQGYSAIPFEAAIYNTNGAIIKNVEMVTGINSVNVNDLQPGVYFIKMIINNEIVTRKFVK